MPSPAWHKRKVERSQPERTELLARLLVVDPLAAAYACSENDRGLVRAFMTNLDGWARATGCAVLIVSHPPKSEADYSGSTDWHAAARAVWKLGTAETDAGNGGKVKEKAPAPRLDCLKTSYGTPNRQYWLSGWPAWKAVDAQQAAVDYGSLKAKFQGTDGKAAAAAARATCPHRRLLEFGRHLGSQGASELSRRTRGVGDQRVRERQACTFAA